MRVREAGHHAVGRNSTPAGAGVNHVASASFESALKQADAASAQRIDALFDEVESAGYELRRNPTLETLLAYKRAVSGFMRRALREMFRVDVQRGFDRKGRRTQSILVFLIDEKLEALTRRILSGENDAFVLAGLLDELRGLLLDLYH